jgi:hypothetical protein
VKLAERFMKFDGAWGAWSISPLKWAAAQVNSLRRYLALAATEIVVRPQPTDRAELLMLAERPKASPTHT